MCPTRPSVIELPQVAQSSEGGGGGAGATVVALAAEGFARGLCGPLPFPFPDEAAAATCDDADADGDAGALLALTTGAAEADAGGAVDAVAVLAAAVDPLDALEESAVGAMPRSSGARMRRKRITAIATSASTPGSARRKYTRFELEADPASCDGA